MNGYGEFTSGSGNTYKGFYFKDKKHGFGVYNWKDQSKAFVGFWENGKMHGIGYMVTKKAFQYGKWNEGKRIEWTSVPNYLIINKLFKDLPYFKQYFKSKLADCVIIADI